MSEQERVLIFLQWLNREADTYKKSIKFFQDNGRVDQECFDTGKMKMIRKVAIEFEKIFVRKTPPDKPDTTRSTAKPDNTGE